MARKDKGKDGDDARSIPTSRAGRLARMARMAGGVAGGMLAEGTRQLRAGKRPKARDLLLTPGNARRVAEQLSTMRGAAMKVGQILSMDTGEFLPRELADILARLRDDARQMPPAQLQRAMPRYNERLGVRPHARGAGEFPHPIWLRRRSGAGDQRPVGTLPRRLGRQDAGAERDAVAQRSGPEAGGPGRSHSGGNRRQGKGEIAFNQKRGEQPGALMTFG